MWRTCEQVPQIWFLSLEDKRTETPGPAGPPAHSVSSRAHVTRARGRDAQASGLAVPVETPQSKSPGPCTLFLVPLLRFVSVLAQDWLHATTQSSNTHDDDHLSAQVDDIVAPLFFLQADEAGKGLPGRAIYSSRSWSRESTVLLSLWLSMRRLHAHSTCPIQSCVLRTVNHYVRILNQAGHRRPLAVRLTACQA